jgi:hypothetical protein
MFKRIKGLIKKSSRLSLIVYCARGLISSQKCEEILNSDKRPDKITLIHYGDLNRDKIIYYISLQDEYKVQGFCSLLRYTLKYLYYADTMNFTPVVEHSKELLYSEESEVNGHTNPYEYYFQQTSCVTLLEAQNSDKVVRSRLVDTTFCGYNTSYGFEQKEIDFYSRIYSKYIKLNPKISNMIEHDLQKIKKYRTLGVHVRGTDYKIGYNRHPVVVTEDEFLIEIEKCMKNYNFEYVFLATDEEKTVDVFRKKFGEKLIIHDDTYRSKDGNAIHYGNNIVRPNHKFLLGYEILRDVYSLATCEGLLAGESNVSVLARVINKSNNSAYTYLNILNNGFHNNKKESLILMKRIIGNKKNNRYSDIKY